MEDPVQPKKKKKKKLIKNWAAWLLRQPCGCGAKNVVDFASKDPWFKPQLCCFLAL